MEILIQLIVGAIIGLIAERLFTYFTVDKIVNDLTSKDGKRIIKASLKIKNITSRIRLRQIAIHIEKIKSTTKNIHYEDSDYPKHYHKDYAIRKLKFVKFTNDCFCNTYIDDHCFDIYAEQQKGEIQITQESATIRNSTCKLIKCKKCHKIYRAFPPEGSHKFWNINEHQKLKNRTTTEASQNIELSVDLETIKSVIARKNTDLIYKLATLIVEHSDIDSLKELSLHTSEILKLFSQVEYDENDEYLKAQFIFAMDILDNLQFGRCYCSSYIAKGGNPDYYMKIGNLNILEKRIHKDMHEIEYFCECNHCKKLLKVKWVDSGHSGQHMWNYAPPAP